MPGVTWPAGWALLKFRYLCTGDPEEMIWTLGADYDPLAVSLLDVANSAVSAHNLTWAAANILNTYTFVGVSALAGPSPPGGLTAESITNRVGTASGGPVTPNTAVLVRKQTAGAGRKNRGRLFAPPFQLAETNVDQVGTIAAGTLTTLQTDWTALRTNLLASVAIDDIGLFHTNPADAPTPVSSFIVQTKVATQRRRMRR